MDSKATPMEKRKASSYLFQCDCVLACRPRLTDRCRLLARVAPSSPNTRPCTNPPPPDALVCARVCGRPYPRVVVAPPPSPPPVPRPPPRTGKPSPFEAALASLTHTKHSPKEQIKKIKRVTVHRCAPGYKATIHTNARATSTTARSSSHQDAPSSPWSALPPTPPSLKLPAAAAQAVDAACATTPRQPPP